MLLMLEPPGIDPESDLLTGGGVDRDRGDLRRDLFVSNQHYLVPVGPNHGAPTGLGTELLLRTESQELPNAYRTLK